MGQSGCFYSHPRAILGQLGCFYQHLGAISGLSQNRKINVSKESELTLMLPNSQGCFFYPPLGTILGQLGCFHVPLSAILGQHGCCYPPLGAILGQVGCFSPDHPTHHPTNQPQPSTKSRSNHQQATKPPGEFLRLTRSP